MQALMTKEGLMIPNEVFSKWGEVEIEERPFQIIVRPRSVTQLTYGILKSDPKLLERILEDVETGGAAIDYGEPAAGLHAQ